jgi:hypothetical protein
MFLENFPVVIILIIALLVGGVYFAYVVTKSHKPNDSTSGLQKSNDPLVNARAECFEKLEELLKPVSKRYLIFCQEKKDVDGYVDSSLTRFERDCENLFSDWKKETQLCNSHYMLKQIFEKYSSRIDLLCEEQKTYLETISSFPSRNEKNLSITA